MSVHPFSEDSRPISSRDDKNTESGQLQPTFSQGASANKAAEKDERDALLKSASKPSTVPEQPSVQQMPQIQAKQSIPEDASKQPQKLSSANKATSKSGEGLNLISKLIETEPAKQLVNQKQSEDTSLAKPVKDDKSKESSTSGDVQGVKIQPTKQLSNQKQNDHISSARPPKDVKRKGSSSSVSSLSDIIQDIRISPREAKSAAENIPTKGR